MSAPRIKGPSARHLALAAAFKAGARWSASLAEPWDKLGQIAEEYARDPIRFRIKIKA